MNVDVPMLKPRPKVRKVAYVVVSADKGLCGAYNANLLRMAWKSISADPRAVLYTVGKKASDIKPRKPEERGKPRYFPIKDFEKNLKNGLNVLAIEGHNS